MGLIIEPDAPIDSPTFTGVPTAPTAAVGTNTTQLATTEFVQANADYTLIACQALGSVIKGEPIGLHYPSVPTQIGMLNNTAFYIAIYLPIAATLTGVKFYQVTQGAYTANNNNEMALYSYSGGTITRVAVSANDGNMWKGASNTMQTVAFASTYAAAAGVYYVGLIYNRSAETTAPVLAVQLLTDAVGFTKMDFTNSAKLVGIVNAQSALDPNTEVMSNISAHSRKYWVGVY